MSFSISVILLRGKYIWTYCKVVSVGKKSLESVLDYGIFKNNLIPWYCEVHIASRTH